MRLVGVFVVLLGMISAGFGGDAFEVGQVLPEVNLVKDGRVVDLRGEVKGKTMVHVFASW